MNTRRSAVDKASDLGYRKPQPGFFNRLRTAPVVCFFQFQIEFTGNVRPAQGECAPDGGQALDGKHAGNDRNINPHAAQPCHQFKIFAGVEKKLGNDEIRTGFDFSTKIFAIVIKGRGFRMRRRIAGYPHAEVPSSAAYETHQLFRAGKGSRSPFRPGVARPVAAQRKQVIQPGIAEFFKRPRNVFFLRAYTGKVGHGFHIVIPLQAGGDFQRVGLDGPSRSAGYGCKKRVHGFEPDYPLKEGGPLFPVLWGEEFQRIERGRTLTDEIEDFHLKFLALGCSSRT